MYTLIAFATRWGSLHGGINSFNSDFLRAFGVAYSNNAQIICVVGTASSAEITSVQDEAGVILVTLPYPPSDEVFREDHGRAGLAELTRLGISFEPTRTICLGHDRFTGRAAIAAAKAGGGRSAIIHHMSYSHYESYAESSSTEAEKEREQQEIFKQADCLFAIGPLLGDSLRDLVRPSKPISVLIPGLAEIKVCEPPQTFTAFLSGRLSEDAARIKQTHLGIAAFAQDR